MDRKEDTRYTLEELASLSGYTRRTIRYYIAEGILSGPVTMGRGAEYTAEHLQRLQDIKEMQIQGKTIPEILKVANSVGKVVESLPLQKSVLKYRESIMPQLTELFGSNVWEEVLIGGGVRVSIRVNETPERKEHIRKALGIFMEALNEKSDETKGIEGED